MARKIFASLILLALVAFPIVGQALEVSAGDHFKAKLLGLPSAGITPNSPIYGLDLFFKDVRPLFSFSDSRKAALYVRFSLEKMSEIMISVSGYTNDNYEPKSKEHIKRSRKAMNTYLSRSSVLIKDILSDNPSASTRSSLIKSAKNLLLLRSEFLKVFDNILYDLQKRRAKLRSVGEPQNKLNTINENISFLNQVREAILIDLDNHTEWMHQL